MKTLSPGGRTVPQAGLILGWMLFATFRVSAQPILTSWFTNNSTVLARAIQSTTLTSPVTTWSAGGVANNNTGGIWQTNPACSDVQRIRYTATDVYINATPALAGRQLFLRSNRNVYCIDAMQTAGAGN